MTSSPSGYSRRPVLLGLGAATLLPAAASAQDIGDLLRGQIARAVAGQTGAGLPAGVTGAEAEGGLREALTNGAIAAVTRLGRTDGYWGDSTVRIPLPRPLNQVQDTLRALRMAGVLDDLQLRMNRGAESAAPQARSIFGDAIRSFTITDIVQVLRGDETAGTQLLSERTRPGLLTLFRPPLTSALNQSGASPAFDRAASRYNRQLGRLGGLSGLAGQAGVQQASGDDLRSQFVDYCTGKALDGLFHYVGQEEAAIRRDPVKRTSDLLRRVFGGL
jgi:hypothetical protein